MWLLTLVRSALRICRNATPSPRLPSRGIMERPGPSDAPQEVIDEIIDYCSGNKKTLIACSLTSRAWVYRTRKHLFSNLTLTDKTLPVWCGIVVTPAAAGDSKPQPPPNSCPSPASSYASCWLSSYVISLQLVSTYNPTGSNDFGAQELLRAKTYLSAFTNLESLTFTVISFAAFDDRSLKACFGALSKTVRNLRLLSCDIYRENFPSFLKLFTRLESFEIEGNRWHPGPGANVGKDPILLRGSFTLSDLKARDCGMLDFLMAQRMEYETITLGHNVFSERTKLNVLFAKCKKLKILSFTAQCICRAGDRTNLDLSPCEELSEVQARFIYPYFKKIIPILRTIASPRFRKLSLLVFPPFRDAECVLLDSEVTALAERVNATAVTDRLEVVFSYYSTGLGEIGLSEIKWALPWIASDARVSLRVEKLLPPLGY